jgi:hypothetical protein
MNETVRMQQKLDHLWTTQDLCRGFDKEAMTIYLWRKNEDLPAIRIAGDRRDTIRFVPNDVLAWAKRKGKTFNQKAVNSSSR